MGRQLRLTTLMQKIVDLATLTGVCIVALGPSIAGIFTPSDKLEKEVVAASKIAGENFGGLLIEESYWDSMKSGVADMVNTGGNQGGSITATLFLKQFVDEKVEWLHIIMLVLFGTTRKLPHGLSFLQAHEICLSKTDQELEWQHHHMIGSKAS